MKHVQNLASSATSLSAEDLSGLKDAFVNRAKEHLTLVGLQHFLHFKAFSFNSPISMYLLINSILAMLLLSFSDVGERSAFGAGGHFTTKH
jgi:hypothetical protein